MIREHRWIAKALVQKAASRLGFLPLYHLAQRMGGRLKGFHPGARIEYAGKLAADVGLDRLSGASVVEIGSGWVPIVPMGLYLLGAREVHSFDLSRHLQPDLSLRAARLLPECFAELAQRSGADMGDIRHRHIPLSMMGSWDAIASRIGFHYHAPADVTESAIAPASVDIVYSNLVLEHVTPSALDAILAHSWRILKPGGVCWHNIDYTDHYSHTHKGLSAINFLRYGDRFWAIVGQNDILYMNRLRRSDYLAAFERAGFAVASIHDYTIADSEVIESTALNSRFVQYAANDLRCGASRVVLRKG